MHYALGIFLRVSFNISYRDLVVVNKLNCSEFFITHQLLAVIPAYTYFQMYNDNPKS